MIVQAVRRPAEDGPVFAAPLRAIDDVQVIRTCDGFSIHATKSVCASDPYLVGHFPGCTIFPGVFMVESLCQAMAVALGPRDGRLPVLRVVESVRFLAPLQPGHTMTLDALVKPVGGQDSFAVTCDLRRSEGKTIARLKAVFGYEEMALA